MLKVTVDASGIATLWLDVNPSKPRGGVVVLDAWLIEALRVALESILAGPAPTGFILASASPRVFVAGADLAEIDALDDAQLDVYLRAGSHSYGLIRALPCPSVAVIHRAALGGGLEVAMHCDALIGVLPGPGEKSWRVGLPECGLAICPGWGGTQMLPARIDPETAIRATALGETWDVTKIPAGLFARTIDPARLAEGASAVDAAHAAAREWLTAHPRRATTPVRAIDRASAGPVGEALARVRPAIEASESGRTIAQCVEIGVRHGFEAAVAHERTELIRLRHTPAAREKLTAFLKR